MSPYTGRGMPWCEAARDYLAGRRESAPADDAFENASDYLTVRFICDRAIANELVRHRVFSFCQESTRYVCYSGEIEFVPSLFRSLLGGDGYARVDMAEVLPESEELP